MAGCVLYFFPPMLTRTKHNSFQLILYWYGVPNPETGMNLSTCLWQSRKHAKASASLPHHGKAMALAAEVYEVYYLERYILRKVQGEEGVTIETFTEGEVGW